MAIELKYSYLMVSIRTTSGSERLGIPSQFVVQITLKEWFKVSIDSPETYGDQPAVYIYIKTWTKAHRGEQGVVLISRHRSHCCPGRVSGRFRQN